MIRTHDSYRIDYSRDDDAEDAYRSKLARRDARATRSADRSQDDRPNLETSYFAACGIAR